MRKGTFALVLGALLLRPGEAGAQTGPLQPSAATVETFVTGGGSSPLVMYAPVVIRGRKFLMQVDTGASSTIIDKRVSRQLGLAAGGKVRTRTIGCTTTSLAVQIDEWRVGEAPIPSVKAVAIRVSGKLRQVRGLTVAGLLGADALSFFRTVGVDFRNGKLILDRPFVPTPHTFSVRTAISRDTGRPTFMVANVNIHGRRTRMAIDTGAAATTLDRSIARRAHLRPVGRKVTVGAVSCKATVQPMRLNRWKVGGRRVPGTFAAVRRTGLPERTRGLLYGLVGTDVFDHFGKVTLDYERLRVALGFARIGVFPEG